METQTGLSFIPATPMTDDDLAAVERDYRDHRAARWCSWPNYEQRRAWKQDVALAAAEAFMAANPVVCPECNGKGDAGRNNPANICEECNGSGKYTVRVPAAPHVEPEQCGSCKAGDYDWCWNTTPCPRPFMCDDCKRGNHARCLPTGNCNCCNRVEVAA